MIMDTLNERTAVVLITGALTGIGRATAFEFARQGAKLIVSGRREQAGRALEKELRELGADVDFVQADVRHEKEVENLVDHAVKRFGRLDIAVNNAGTEGTPGSIVDATPETYAATFDTNVLGVLLSLKHELRVMQGQRSGSIVNIRPPLERSAEPVRRFISRASTLLKVSRRLRQWTRRPWEFGSMQSLLAPWKRRCSAASPVMIRA
jgi:NAD(P)-dependent dehydrogenase (short-subunit alcohol dehydrogenase family)